MTPQCCVRAKLKVTINQEGLKHTARRAARADQKRPGERREEFKAEIARYKGNIAEAERKLANHEAEHAGDPVSA